MNQRLGAHEWLAIAQAQLAAGNASLAQVTLAQALLQHPESAELRRVQAGALQQSGRHGEAELLLREVLDTDPGDAASAFALANLLKAQGRTAAAASVILSCLAQPPNRREADLAIHAIELLADCDRKADAAVIVARAIEANPDDARLHAYAGMLLIQLGRFSQARQHYRFALEHDPRAWEWHAGIGLTAAQRYPNHADPDFTLLEAGLQRQDLSDRARTELHFALGKMHDDVRDFERATQHFRKGNAIAHRSTRWSRKAWRRSVEARLATGPTAGGLGPFPGFTPIFIVGMPRSGTTLLAELLSRDPRVANRGELPWIAKLAELPALLGRPSQADLQDAAATYATHSRRDDAGSTRWFIDKQPLNFRYVDLMQTLFPDARILYCRRAPRDTALSLWMQCFLEDVQGYSYDFADIALVMRDCERLMTRWQARWPDSIRTVWYEELVSDSRHMIDSLLKWIGLMAPGSGPSAAMPGSTGSVISTASLWQARQPVNSRSIGRWRNYAEHLPELLRFPGVPASSPAAV